MRRRTARRPMTFLLAMAVLATAIEFYALQWHFSRELAAARTFGDSVVPLSLSHDEPLPTAQPTPMISDDEARAALETTLSAVLAVMMEPRDGRLPQLERLAEAQVVREFLPEINHLKANNLRLGGKSGFEILHAEMDSAEPGRVELRTEERWVYQELDRAGRTVRCLEELSHQRYFLEQRQGRPMLTRLTFEGPPYRQPC